MVKKGKEATKPEQVNVEECLLGDEIPPAEAF